MVAGETSGDLLAGRLLSGLRPLLPAAKLHGIGGPQMAQHGFVSDWPMEKLAVRGLFEVLAHYREIKGIQTALKQQLLRERPAVFIGVDAPDFNLSLEMALKNAGIPTMHFISPSIWAWRGGRIRKIAAAVSHMLVVFPFEEQIYRAAGITVTYVGHPLAEVIPMTPDVAGARRMLGLPPDAPVIAILPGSRMSELKYNAAPFIEAARLLLAREPALRIVVPMAGAVQAQYFERLMREAGLQDVPLQVVLQASHTALAAADAVLVASGTASLEVALFKKPMVIAYKMLRASWEIMRHLGYQPWIGLPNILAREFLVPELLQNAATPVALAEAMRFQLQDAGNREKLVRRFTDMHHALLRNTARESAEAVMQLIDRTGRSTSR
ncbi:MAG: lipid-A-disaccharide synthase [Herminiimonas sp.]|nr:lipid-A-disaccharide synthase [Herminiimonas sp.]